MDDVDHVMVHYLGNWADTHDRSNPQQAKRSCNNNHFCSQHIVDIFQANLCEMQCQSGGVPHWP